MRHTIQEGKKTRFVAAEPASCPKLTRGKFQYDFGDEAGYTPLLPMFTLGHNFAPAHIHAGGLRYHGAGVIVSQLLKDNLMEAVDIQQLESFEAGCLFAQSEGIIPAPESSHAIAAAIREANKCKETGEEKVILFNLSGHGACQGELIVVLAQNAWHILRHVEGTCHNAALYNGRCVRHYSVSLHI
jgi:tryptophan synthase beta chain